MKADEIPLDLLDVALGCSEDAYDPPAGKLTFASKFTDASAFKARGDVLDVISFCGSNHWRDWVINGTAVPVPYTSGWCHGGFAAAHKSLWPSIEPFIDPDRELLLTGHSAGGSLAEITGDFLREHRAPVHLITFGKPNTHLRWGAPDFSHLETQLSAVHGSDIVARLPRYLYGPVPGQTMLYFSNTGKDMLDPEWARRWRDYELDGWRTDHAMALYTQRGSRFINRQLACNRRGLPIAWTRQ